MPVAVGFGALVGVSLGLTGGGGSILAVPLLVYGLGIGAREAVGVSLAAVGATALVGALHRLWRRELELKTGLAFAVAGILGAPLGTWMGARLPETLLLLLFAGLMLFVAWRMWRAARQPQSRGADSGACRRENGGALQLDTRCAQVVALSGLATGLLSGLFGVGGGFVVVPALVLVTGMSIHKAVATSLLVIAIVSGSGIVSHIFAGTELPPGITSGFVLGGVAGLALGTLLVRRLPPVKLQQGFSILIVAVAFLVFAKNLAP